MNSDIISWINQSLSNKSFWLYFSIRKSPGDGLCFIHSLAISLLSQARSNNITTQELLQKLKYETLVNIDFYEQFYDGSTGDGLVTLMNEYILHKRYNTSYGDMVPNVMANAIGITIIIISKLIDSYSVQMVCPRHITNCTSSTVIIFKIGEHYDGCVLHEFAPIHSGIADLKYKFVSRHTFDNIEILPNYEHGVVIDKIGRA